jgi:hypothetical protein
MVNNKKARILKAFKTKKGGKKATTLSLPQIGGACPCQSAPLFPTPIGGYRATKRNLKYLKKWKQGKSIGFTMRSSLKAKGLIPRANGSYRISKKYQHK